MDGCTLRHPSLPWNQGLAQPCFWASRWRPTATVDDLAAYWDSHSDVTSAWGKQTDMFNTFKMNYTTGSGTE